MNVFLAQTGETEPAVFCSVRGNPGSVYFEQINTGPRKVQPGAVAGGPERDGRFTLECRGAWVASQGVSATEYATLEICAARSLASSGVWSSTRQGLH